MTFQLMLSALPTKKASADEHGVVRDRRDRARRAGTTPRRGAGSGRDRDAVRAARRRRSRRASRRPASTTAGRSRPTTAPSDPARPRRAGRRRTSPSRPGWRCRRRGRACAGAGGAPGSARLRRCRPAGVDAVDRSRSGRKRPTSSTSATAARAYAERRRGQRAGEGGGGEEPADRWADELVRRELDGVQTTVGPRQSFGGDDVGQDRLGRGVVQRLADTEGEGDARTAPTAPPGPPATISASRPMRSIRATSTRTIVRRRSRRSASAPAGREKSSHGRRPTRVTAAKAPGSRVMLSATRGKAIWKIAVGQVRQRRCGQQPPEIPVGGHHRLNVLNRLGCCQWLAAGPCPMSHDAETPRRPSSRPWPTRYGCASCASASMTPSRTRRSPTGSARTRRPLCTTCARSARPASSRPIHRAPASGVRSRSRTVRRGSRGLSRSRRP